MSGIWALVLHGGAGPLAKTSYDAEEQHMEGLIREGGKMLEKGKSAVEVAVEMVSELEASGFHIAGKGASPNANGEWELDASIMDGSNRQAGAVAALKGYKSPIAVAADVMTKSPHVLFVGDGAAEFAKQHDHKRVKKPKSYFEPAVPKPVEKGALQHGTVGAVVCDGMGALAAATSTGGLLNKVAGRVGDTPIIGAGTWADERVAVSCTGQGEYFMRAAVAADVSSRIRYKKSALQKALEGALDDMAYLGGEGGIIAVDCLGRTSFAFNTAGMKRASLNANGDFVIATKR